MRLGLEWQALNRADQDLTVFAHLLDADDRIAAQHDKPPADGQFPTTRWAPGVRFNDQHVLALPADLAPGAYRIAVGFYDPATGARLLVALGDAGQKSAASGGDALIVSSFDLR